MYNINLQHLKVISAIEKEGSMTKAAEKLNLSQSALSHHLKELENNIGARVFERRNKKLWITETGKKILNSSGLIIHELNKLENELNLVKSIEPAMIRISTEWCSAYSGLPVLIRDFKKENPTAQIQIVAEAIRDPLQYLLNGQLDIAVINKKKEKHKKLKYTSFFEDELIVIVYKDHPLAKCKSIVPADLQNQSLIIHDAEDKEADLMQMVLKPNNIQPSRVTKIQLTEVIIEMVKSHLGMAVIAKWLVSSLVNDELVMLPLKDKFSKRSWQLVTHDPQSEMQEKFIEFALSFLA